MNCDHIRPLIPAHLDGELDVVRDAEVIAHLDHCADCANAALAHTARRGLVQEKLPRYTAPSELRAQIHLALADETNPPARPAASWDSLLKIVGTVGALAAALAIGFVWGGSHLRHNLLVAEAVADHIRSLQVDHLTDVASSDRHTVKPWFAGKLDFSPPVFDLAPAGFPLVGGRLERIENHTAAALVFHRRQHTINLYIWPAEASRLPSRSLSRDGYQIEVWSQNGFNFVAVSEIPATELAQFAETYRAGQS